MPKVKRLSKLENTETRNKKMLDYINTNAKVQVMVFKRFRSRYLSKFSRAQNLTRFSNYTHIVVIVRNVIFLSVWPTKE